MQFGDVLRELMEERDMTQKKIAEDLRIAPSTLGNYVRNLREPDYETLKQIAKYFDVSIDFLLHYSKDGKKDFHNEERILQVFRSLDGQNRNILIEQGQVLAKHQKEKERK